MGKKRSEKGGRRGAARRGSSPRDQRRSDTAHNRGDPGASTSGPARLRLTRLMREGAIWDVYVATTAQDGAPNVTQLEFEAAGAGPKRLRYTRPVQGLLLEALHNGTPVSRASLEEELDRAYRDAGAESGTDGQAAPPSDHST